MFVRSILATILIVAPLALTAPIDLYPRVAAPSNSTTSTASTNNTSSAPPSAACTAARNAIVADLATTTSLAAGLSKDLVANGTDASLVASVQSGINAANQGVARIAEALNTGGSPAASDRTDVLNGLTAASDALNSLIGGSGASSSTKVATRANKSKMAKKAKKAHKKLVKGAKKTAKALAQVQTDAQDVLANCN